MKKIKWIVYALLIMTTGCSTSKTVTSWKAENTIPQKYNKVLVLCIIHGTNLAVQMDMEIHLAGGLQDLGQHTVSSLQEYGPRAFDYLNEEEALNKIKNNGVDAVITIELQDNEREKKYITGNPKDTGYGAFYKSFWEYRNAFYHRLLERGFYLEDNRFAWESNFYDLNTRKIVYSVQTQSSNSVNEESPGRAYVEMIVKDMLRNNILRNYNNSVTKAF
jgi:hypothetical protein